MQSYNQILAIGRLTVHPGDSVVGQAIQALLTEVDNGAAHRGHREDDQ